MTQAVLQRGVLAPRSAIALLPATVGGGKAGGGLATVRGPCTGRAHGFGQEWLCLSPWAARSLRDQAMFMSISS